MSIQLTDTCRHFQRARCTAQICRFQDQGLLGGCTLGGLSPRHRRALVRTTRIDEFTAELVPGQVQDRRRLSDTRATAGRDQGREDPPFGWTSSG